MKKAVWTIFLYAAFAVISIAANLLTQAGVFSLGLIGRYPNGWVLSGALVAGTAVGLLVKYGLDKKFIFQDTSAGVAAHSRKFMLYSGMGIATTLIFWLTEALFAHLFHSQAMIYVGGVLGLSVGYIVKYNLDRRFVFNSASLKASSPP